ncbi:MAG: TetR/AcrR family transcriptional regulator [Bacteroidales bacterium]|nr:TetR/AcrR family transcriptional regulator [Bacteroidales bacterium]
MERKEIQEQRIRSYFIEATREMLKGEGLKSINVRAVAERAGYSYATLYNYFKDIKELVFICVKDFQTEAETFAKEKAASSAEGKDRILALTTALIDYFVQYPGIFELFYLERMSTISSKHPTADLIFDFPVELTLEDWKCCVEQKIYSKDEVENRKKALQYLIPGMLLMYLNRMRPESYKEFMKDVKEQIQGILN